MCVHAVCLLAHAHPVCCGGSRWWMDKKSGSVYTIRVVDNLTAPLYVYTRCCEEIVQEDIVVIDNKSLWCLLAGVYMNDL